MLRMHRRRLLTLLGAGALGGAAGTGLALPKGRPKLRDELWEASSDEVDGPWSGVQQIIWSVDTEARVAALTFDDGPDPEFTPRILEILDRHGVRATFMAMGHNAVRHRSLLKEVVAAGHEIGAHGWNHLNLASATLAEARTEIEFGTGMIEECVGVPVRVFRPPYGRFSEASLRLLAQRGCDMVVWSVTRGKLAWQEPDRVAAHVTGALRPGDIIDLHDGIGRGTFNPGTELAARLSRRREVEVQALPQILKGARTRSLKFSTISELVAGSRPLHAQRGRTVRRSSKS
jgi:peptidoglycan/xylan/chitin deacetylase (PgdA/CDA1 family)